ncbi:MAG: radical SAM protein [Nitrospinota bacterium]
MPARMVFADEGGRVYDHPELALAGFDGEDVVAPEPEDLIPLPPGSKLFTLPGSRAVGLSPETGEALLADSPGPSPPLAAAAFPAPGYARTLLPAAHYEGEGKRPPLPLWPYTACGFEEEGGFVVAAIRVDESARWEPERYDDTSLPELVRERLAASPRNRLLKHLSRCALDYHCFAAKNLFLGRWEVGLPVAPLCNADCRGCLSFQPAGEFPASHERIDFVPTAEELAEVAVPHLERAEFALASFGQGCEGEPLLQARQVERAVRLMREATPRGTVHLNTNGSRPEWIPRLAAAGLDSVRVSLNSAQPELYRRYYRPAEYGFGEVRETIARAVGAGLYTSLNYFVFPGVSDREEELEALLRLAGETGFHLLQLRNLSIDPGLYLRSMPRPRGRLLGVRRWVDGLRRELPGVALGYFNRPKEEWRVHPSASLPPR